MKKNRRTKDGVRLESVVKTLESLSGVKLRDGTKHSYIILMDDYPPTPLGESTRADCLSRQVGKHLGYDPKVLYACMRKGHPYSQ